MTWFPHKVLQSGLAAIFEKRWSVSCKLIFLFSKSQSESVMVVRKIPSCLGIRTIHPEKYSFVVFLSFSRYRLWAWRPMFSSWQRRSFLCTETWKLVLLPTWPLTMGSGCFTSRNKTLEEDHSLQYGLGFVNPWTFTFTPTFSFIALCFYAVTTILFAHVLKFVIGWFVSSGIGRCVTG